MMEQRYKNFLLLLAALACFAVGAVLFIGDDDMVYEQTEESEEPDNGSGGDTGNDAEEAEDTDEGEEAVSSSTVENESIDFFENYRLQRDKRRDAQLELYQGILSDEGRDEATKESAQAMLEKLYQVAAVEDKVEEILIGRNYNDVIFVLEDTVSLLIIKKPSLNDDEKAALTSFVSSYAGVAADSLSVFTVD